jgi:hypothetical protein
VLTGKSIFGAKSKRAAVRSDGIATTRRLFNFDDSNFSPDPSHATDTFDIQVQHDAKHDIEAFFWVLTYICLTRKGPGGQRRDELKPNAHDSPYTRQVRRSYYAIFGSENVQDLIRNKTNLFVYTDDYGKYVASYFHPYFYPLRNMMVKWCALLRLAHQEPVFEALHDWTLYTLDQYILRLDTVSKTNLKQEDMTAAAAVDAERSDDLKSLQFFGSEAPDAQHMTKITPSVAGAKSPNVGKAQLPWDMSPDAGQLGTPGMSYRGEPVAEPESPTPKRPTKKARNVG